MKKILPTIFCFLLLFSINTFAQDTKDNAKVAKAIILKGTVGIKPIGEKEFTRLNKDDFIPEGSVVKTADKSFVKILFLDKSQMNVGPKSEIEVNTFKKEEPGIVSLVKGQIRASVTKDYMDMKKDGSKLYVKTQTAAMGVRGTEFQVNYNPANESTALVTFSGAVAMARLDNGLSERMVDRSYLEKTVSSPEAVLVQKGEFSGASPKNEAAIPPTKISPVQFEQLKSTDMAQVSQTESEKSPAKESETKQFRNPIPPGVDTKLFSNQSGEMEKQLVTTLGEDGAKKVVTQAVVEIAKESGRKIEEVAATINPNLVAVTPQALAQVNSVASATNQPATQTAVRAPADSGPRPGGALDLNTLTYVEPPKNSAFDANTNTYVLPPEMGAVKNGVYEPPKGFVLTNEGTFKVDPVAQRPAATGTNTSMPPTLPPTMMMSQTGSGLYAGTQATGPITAPTNTWDPKEIEAVKQEVHQSYTNNTAPVVQQTTTVVRFIIN